MSHRRVAGFATGGAGGGGGGGGEGDGCRRTAAARSLLSTLRLLSHDGQVERVRELLLRERTAAAATDTQDTLSKPPPPERRELLWFEYLRAVVHRDGARQAPTALTQMERMGVAPHRLHYVYVIRKLGEGGHRKLATSWFFRRMRSLGGGASERAPVHRRLSGPEIGAFCSAFKRLGDVSSVRRVMSFAKRNKIHPNVRDYEVIIATHSKAKDVEGALELYRTVTEEHKLAPTYYMNISLLSAYGAVGDVERVKAQLRRPPSHGSAGDEVQLRLAERNVLITALARSGRVDDAKAILADTAERMAESVRMHAYMPVVTALVAESRLDEAEALLADAQQRHAGVKADDYIALVRVFRQRGDAGGLESLLARMERRGLPPPLVAIRALQQLFARAGLRGRAAALLGRLVRERGARVVADDTALSAAALSLCNGEDGGDADAADIELLRREVAGPLLDSAAADAAAEAPPPRKADRYVSCALVTALGRRGDVDAALRVLRRAQADGVADAAVYNAMMDALLRARRRADAASLLSEMVRAAATATAAATAAQPNTRTLSIWVREPAAFGEVDEVRAWIVKLARQFGVRPDARVWEQLEHAYLKAGRPPAVALAGVERLKRALDELPAERRRGEGGDIAETASRDERSWLQRLDDENEAVSP